MIDWNASSMPIMNRKLERKGISDINLVYNKAKEWFHENNYEYTEKENTTIKRDKGTEIKMAMICQRNVTDYFRFAIEIKYLVIESEKVKIKNKSLDRAYFRIWFKANMIFDYKHTWEKNKISKILRFIYNNFIIKNKIDNIYSVALKFESDDIFNTVKEALEMYN